MTMKTMSSGALVADQPVVLVTGAAGFLGQALVREALAPRGEAPFGFSELRLFDVRDVPAPDDPRVTVIRGDVCSAVDMDRACRGAHVVIHLAALIDWGHQPPARVHAVNVEGTRNVLRAAATAGVRALVFTSSMDVVVDGKPVVDVDETFPVPATLNGAYATSKAMAEREVLAADGRPWPGGGGSLRTCAIRPCGMFGEADPYHVTEVLNAARSGALLFRMGSGKARFQHVYVGNVAHAVLLAARALLAQGCPAGGRSYFVTDHPADNFFDFMAPIVEGAGYRMPPRWRALPAPLMYVVGAGLELATRALRPVIRVVPPVTRLSVLFITRDHTFCGDRACRELGYAPVYSAEEALERTVSYFREHGPVRR